MKRILTVIILLLTGAGLYLYLDRAAAPGFEPEAGYTLLYDGKSLAGWRVIGGAATFEADGPDIVGRHGPGANTFLRTEQTFSDFSLKLQMHWDEHGNSGVLFRAAQRDGDGRAYGYQYELDPSERAWSGGIYDEGRRGWLASLEDNAAAREAVRLDGWNDVEIEARGARLRTWINGVPAADIVDGLDGEGYVALQVHSGDAGIMRWRHIRIRELPGVAGPADNLLTAEEWRDGDEKGLHFEGDDMLVPPGGADAWLESRRQFKDFLVRMNLPACEEPTRVQVRHRVGETGGAETFAELALYADRAEGRLVGPGGEKAADPVPLEPAARHNIIAIARGQDVVFTVGEHDVLRLDRTRLYERGPLRILPGRCEGEYRVADLQWWSLKERSPEPLFYETLDNEPAPVLSPEEALEAFRIAPGFEIELVASEPLVGEPVAMDWDEYGRLYVVEMRGYMRDAYGTDSDDPVGQIVRLTDTDGDGRMDESEVFLGELVNPRAVAVVNEGVLIGEPPNLWLCELPRTGALCENRRRVGSYAADTEANVEHMENGLRRGLDNWMYNAKSDRQLRLVDGSLQEREGYYRGQWGIAKDDYGRWFYNHNSTWLQADFFQAEDIVVPGARSYPLGLGVNLTNPAEVFSVRVNPGVNRAYLKNTLRKDGRLNRATGVSGLAIYRGDQFPGEYSGDAFVPEPAGNVVARFALTEDGMALAASQRLYPDAQWGQRDFLASTDERFRPVDAMNGPDGALYIIDMYRGIIQDDHFLTDELREQILQRGLDAPLGMGRIWRVRHAQGAKSGAVQLAGAGDVELVAALSHANGWVRDTAQRILLGSEGDFSTQLEALAEGDSTVAALHALWTLAGRGELRRELVLRIASSGDVQRQVQALRAGRGLLTPEDLIGLAAASTDAAEAVRVQLAFAMGDHAAYQPVRDTLANLLGAGLASPYLRQAIVHAVGGHELAFLRDFLDTPAIDGQSPGAEQILMGLSVAAYRTLRGDLTSSEPAGDSLLALLALVESRSGDHGWQQIAMLKGLQLVSRMEDFEPALLGAVPPIFADSAISASDPLWEARLAGRRAFTWPGDELAMGLEPLSPEQLQLVEKGKAFYAQCAACHGAEGRGVTGLAPALAGASWVTGPPEWLGRIILHGMTGPVEVNGEVFEGVMPGHGHIAELDDATLAGLMTHLRRSWGNSADPVTVQQAAGLRESSAGREQPWTAEELQRVPYDRGFARFEGRYSISFVTLTVIAKTDGLYVSVPMYGEGKMQQISDTTFRVSAAGENVKLEFVVENDGSVDRLVMYRKGEKIPINRDI